MINFVKMHGTGNDFIVVEGPRQEDDSVDWQSLAPGVCDRRFGVGADGVLVIRPADSAAFSMQIFNSDGSEAEMCGNGIRCVTKYVLENGIVAGTNGAGILVDTLAGAMTVWPVDGGGSGGAVSAVRVDMGSPEFAPERIPVAVAGPGPVIGHSLNVGGHAFDLTFVSMGNPHAVAFLDTPVNDFPLDAVGPQMEHHAIYPNRVNFEIVNVLARDRLRLRVWERGAGLTMACGTGACAAVAAARMNGLVDDTVTVELPGGALTVEWNGDTSQPVYMTGPAETVFTGTLG